MELNSISPADSEKFEIISQSSKRTMMEIERGKELKR
jgi:hypothetical protein